MSRPRILIADDHTMMVEGLSSLLKREFELAGTVADGDALLGAVRDLAPDAVVCDIAMPALNGIQVLHALRAGGLHVPVVILSMHADKPFVREALRLGARGYVLKHSAADELIIAIKAALAGDIYVTPLLAAENWLDTGQPGEQSGSLSLTPRQRDVVRLIAEGCTMKQVAARLGISVRTAESHKYDMMEKFGVNSTAQLAQVSERLGLLSESPADDSRSPDD
jgi:DNA-binding NarL/FixJ family response regulator